MAEKEKISVVDLSDGRYVCGYPGSFVRRCLKEKVVRLEKTHKDTMDLIAQTIGAKSPEYVASMLVATHDSQSTNAEILNLRALIKKSIDIVDEIETLALLANGFVDTVLYKLSLTEMKRFGIALGQSK